MPGLRSPAKKSATDALLREQHRPDTLTRMSPISEAVVQAFTPHGKLRASINLGNPILASRNSTTGEASGVSVDLARKLGRKLGVEVELLIFEKAMLSVDAVRNERADVGFFAVDPARNDGLRFTAPYVLIEGSYLVGEQSALRATGEVDDNRNRVAVGEGSAYDLFLTRELHAARIE